MGKLGKILRNILIVCGVLFILLLLLPDDEENLSQEQVQTTVVHPTVADETQAAFTEEMVKEKQAAIKGDGSDTVTVLVYMNGSDL